MVKTIETTGNISLESEAVHAFKNAARPVALTGAGISVESGIPDFRSPGGLWTVYPAEEYATYDVFIRDAPKAWKLYREIGKTVEGAKPNPAHFALARLEEAGRLQGVVTQNIDGLHQASGSKNVIEIHGDHQHLQCVHCNSTIPVVREHFTDNNVPECAKCSKPLKPNVVLFGEAVRHMEEIVALVTTCDLVLVVGTSALVAPANSVPALVKKAGGLIFEFNMEKTALTEGMDAFFGMLDAESDYLFLGPAGETLSAFVDKALED